LQNTYNKKNINWRWIDQQESLIASFKEQPFIIVLRPNEKDFNFPFNQQPLYSIIHKLNQKGVKHIEIGWSKHPSWMNLIKDLRYNFNQLSIGVASVTSSIALDDIYNLDIDYAMSPFWDTELQISALELNQILIPGVFSPTEIQKAIGFGWRMIKLFPAYSLGEEYIKKLKPSMQSLPFVIAAGGLNLGNVRPWISHGYGAIVIGRSFLNNEKNDKNLSELIKIFSKDN